MTYSLENKRYEWYRLSFFFFFFFFVPSPIMQETEKSNQKHFFETSDTIWIELDRRSDRRRTIPRMIITYQKSVVVLMSVLYCNEILKSIMMFLISIFEDQIINSIRNIPYHEWIAKYFMKISDICRSKSDTSTHVIIQLSTDLNISMHDQRDTIKHKYESERHPVRSKFFVKWY